MVRGVAINQGACSATARGGRAARRVALVGEVEQLIPIPIMRILSAATNHKRERIRLCASQWHQTDDSRGAGALGHRHQNFGTTVGDVVLQSRD
jgi:hypothetical protein